VDIFKAAPFVGCENEGVGTLRVPGTQPYRAPFQILGDSKEIGQVRQEKNLHPKTQPAMLPRSEIHRRRPSYQGCLGTLLAGRTA
jgi:hypothetical protein